MKTSVAIAGYGNLGKAVLANLKHFPDLELVGIISRRPKSIELDGDDEYPVYDYADAKLVKADVVIMCGGSALDLPVQSPEMAKYFNIVDSFDTHAKISEHFKNVDASAKASGKVAAISIGWDPGLFSLMRVLFGSVLPSGKDYTFWGKGVSQGHSDAIRKIDGVKKAIQYTIPKEDAIKYVESGMNPQLSVKQKHLRECFVVAEEKDKARIEKEIVTMPNYFAPYETVVHFISDEEFLAKHTALPHGGRVIRSGETDRIKQFAEFKIKLDSNPHFTASVLMAYARAVARLNREGKSGALTALDIPFSYLSDRTAEDLMQNLI